MTQPLSEADVIAIVKAVMQQPGLMPTEHAFSGGQGNAVATGKPVSGHYGSKEFDNGSVTGTATIDWSRGNVQYATMTGATTFTFIKPLSGGRYLFHLAGAFTPTWPATVRWPSSTTPTPTASSGKKDIIGFIYSGKEGLYDGIQTTNFATT